MTTHNELEALARTLEMHPDFRVLRRLSEETIFHPVGDRQVSTGLILDTETTGLTSSDAVIELGMIRFEFDAATGQVFKITDSYNGLEDPGVPIGEQAQSIHGITPQMIAGKRFDDAAVRRVTQGVNLVIAHNATFDRPMIEKRYRQFAMLPWACSLQEIDWKSMGFGSGSLEFIATRYGFFYEAHGAITDCRALLEILHRGHASGTPLLRDLSISSKAVVERLWAINAPYERKDLLKQRGYRWNADNPKAWWIQVTRKEAWDERQWLLSQVYHTSTAKIRIDVIDATSRYSNRLTDSAQRVIHLNEEQ